MAHKRPPLFCTGTLRYSYKLYEIESQEELLSEQQEMAFKKSVAFIGEEQTRPFESLNKDRPFDPRAALEAAKQSASLSKARKGPTSRSSIIVGEGKGRQTRELEIQWWPNLYKTNFGKMTFRFFVHKTIY